MYLETQSSVLFKGQTTNSTLGTFQTLATTGTEPSADGVQGTIGPNSHGAVAPTRLRIIPYCLGSDNDTFSMRLWGWEQGGTIQPGRVFIPLLLGEFSCTACAQVGIAGGYVLTTERFCDTITLAAGNLGTTGSISSPTNDLIASIVIEVRGCQKWQFDFQTGGAPPTSMNCLWGRI